MVRKQNKDIEHMRLYIANLMNDEQNSYSKLIFDLKAAAGATNEFPKMLNILTKLYEAKMEVLDKVYKEMQGM